MKLDEAIEIKEAYLKGEAVEHYKHLEADRLSVEALKLLKEIRSVEGTGYSSMLPGETE